MPAPTAPPARLPAATRSHSRSRPPPALHLPPGLLPSTALLLLLQMWCRPACGTYLSAGCYPDASCNFNCTGSLCDPALGCYGGLSCAYDPFGASCAAPGARFGAYTCGVDTRPAAFDPVAGSNATAANGTCLTSPLAAPPAGGGSGLAPCGVCGSGEACRPVAAARCDAVAFLATAQGPPNPAAPPAAGYACAPACFGGDAGCGAGCPLGSACGVSSGATAGGCPAGQFACLRPGGGAAGAAAGALCHPAAGCGGACPPGAVCAWDAAAAVCPGAANGSGPGFACVDTPPLVAATPGARRPRRQRRPPSHPL